MGSIHRGDALSAKFLDRMAQNTNKSAFRVFTKSCRSMYLSQLESEVKY